MQQASFLTDTNSSRIAYRINESGAEAGNAPGILFLTGFKSDMQGAKALALDAHCKKTGQRYVRFDYSGHGESGGAFEDGTIGAWLGDALRVFDQLTRGPQIVVGSSMGGWIACLLALARPERVAGMIGIAAAPDFTERLIWDKFSVEEQSVMLARGYVDVPNCYGEDAYRITRQLVEEGRNHLILDGPVAIGCPVRLLHGMEDEDVPWQVSQKLLEKLESRDVQLTLIKEGKHRLSEPLELALVVEAVRELSSRRRPGSADMHE